MRTMLIFLIFIMMSSLQLLESATGGKLAGRVTDMEDRALPAVNILIEASEMGTASDEDGNYFILNVPPGEYDLKFMMIGYKTVIKTGVQINTGLTRQLDVTMEPTVLESGESVIVTAERPLIQKDATSRIQIIESDEIVNLPVNDFRDILSAQAGFTKDANNEIHVRGGRSGEIRYMVDGIIIEDPVGGSFEGSINPNSISELSIISGAFNAEYGQAMSSIVNIVTKDGSEGFSGKIEFSSDRINESPYHSPGAFEAVDDANYEYIDLGERLYTLIDYAPEDYYPRSMLPLFRMPGKGRLSLDLSGRLPLTKTFYYISTQMSEYDSYLPHGVNSRSNLNLKLTRNFGERFKFRTNFRSESYLYQHYEHDWKYLPLHNSHTLKLSDRMTMQANHSLSSATFYTASYAMTRIQSKTSNQLKQPDRYERPIQDQQFVFWESGDDGEYSENKSLEHTVKFDISSQVNSRHFLQSGFHFKTSSLDILKIQDPWDGGINFRDDSTFTPKEAAFYIQDKIEFDFLIINAGLRFDYLDPSASMWEDVTRFVEFDSSGQLQPAAIEKAPPKYQFSPRLGLAYPVTDNTVFHFSFGHFLQNPGYEAIYYNSVRDITSALPLVGNPKIRSQKTVSFETGLKQTLGERSVMEFSAWMKDIRDLLSTQQIRYLSSQYILYTNSDYASVKGFDLSYRRSGRTYSARFNYSFSIAKGNNSSPLGGYFSAYEQEEVPHEEYYLSFDRRHDIAVAVNMHIPEGLRGWASLFSDTYINILANSASGLPYTPYAEFAERVEPNSERMPWTQSVDLRIKRHFDMGKITLAAYLDVSNLFDHENILFVYPRTGDPFEPGWSGVGSSQDGNYNPAHIGQGRELRLGTYLSW